MRNLLFLLIVAILLATACDREEKTPVGIANISLEELLAEGWLAFSEHDFELADINFETAFEKDSTQIEVNIAKGWTLLMLDAGSLAKSERLLLKGIHSATWKSDARCGLVVIRFIQEQYAEIENLVDLIIADRSDYFFKYMPTIDWHDLLLLKAQAFFYSDEYEKSWEAIQEITTVFPLDPNDHRTWEVNGTRYFSFEAALAKVIEILSDLYKDF